MPSSPSLFVCKKALVMISNRSLSTGSQDDVLHGDLTDYVHQIVKADYIVLEKQSANCWSDAQRQPACIATILARAVFSNVEFVSQSDISSFHEALVASLRGLEAGDRERNREINFV